MLGKLINTMQWLSWLGNAHKNVFTKRAKQDCKAVSVYLSQSLPFHSEPCLVSSLLWLLPNIHTVPRPTLPFKNHLFVIQGSIPCVCKRTKLGEHVVVDYSVEQLLSHFPHWCKWVKWISFIARGVCKLSSVKPCHSDLICQSDFSTTKYGPKLQTITYII